MSGQDPLNRKESICLPWIRQSSSRTLLVHLLRSSVALAHDFEASATFDNGKAENSDPGKRFAEVTKTRCPSGDNLPLVSNSFVDRNFRWPANRFIDQFMVCFGARCNKINFLSLQRFGFCKAFDWQSTGNRLVFGWHSGYHEHRHTVSRLTAISRVPHYIQRCVDFPTLCPIINSNQESLLIHIIPLSGETYEFISRWIGCRRLPATATIVNNIHWIHWI